jgi:hypothetical protein
MFAAVGERRVGYGLQFDSRFYEVKSTDVAITLVSPFVLLLLSKVLWNFHEILCRSS